MMLLRIFLDSDFIDSSQFRKSCEDVQEEFLKCLVNDYVCWIF